MALKRKKSRIRYNLIPDLCKCVDLIQHICGKWTEADRPCTFCYCPCGAPLWLRKMAGDGPMKLTAEYLVCSETPENNVTPFGHYGNLIEARDRSKRALGSGDYQ